MWDSYLAASGVYFLVFLQAGVLYFATIFTIFRGVDLLSPEKPFYNFVLASPALWVILPVHASVLSCVLLALVALACVLVAKLIIPFMLAMPWGPLVWILDRGAHPLRWVALFAFAVGFQFELLAS
jgi:hypothetical protein